MSDIFAALLPGFYLLGALGVGALTAAAVLVGYIIATRPTADYEERDD